MYWSALPLYKRCSAGSQLNRFLSACIMQQSLNIMHVSTLTHTHLHTLAYTCTLLPAFAYEIITLEAFHRLPQSLHLTPTLIITGNNKWQNWSPSEWRGTKNGLEVSVRGNICLPYTGLSYAALQVLNTHFHTWLHAIKINIWVFIYCLVLESLLNAQGSIFSQKLH